MQRVFFFLPQALSHARVFPGGDAKTTLLRDPTYAKIRGAHTWRREETPSLSADGRGTSLQTIHPRISGHLDPNTTDAIIQEQKHRRPISGHEKPPSQAQSNDAFLIGSINALHFPAC